MIILFANKDSRFIDGKVGKMNLCASASFRLDKSSVQEFF